MAHLTFQGAPCDVDVQAAVEQACAVANRITWTPLGFAVRALLLQSAVLPRALYACAVNPMRQ
eukprot:5758100-Karenia_brevis.AAC.1